MKEDLKVFIIEKGGRSPKKYKTKLEMCENEFMDECRCFDPWIFVYNMSLELTSFLSQLLSYYKSNSNTWDTTLYF